ncbi:SDR family oxidoreductase [Novosphingobium sp.]|uniref:SDR family oxidoreductase n=1 Tax=Novosphingobium sp. TaxID=1874826 RepID=UPI002FD95CBA
MEAENNKQVPARVLIFGASGHIGKPLAAFLTREAPQMALRLASRDAGRQAELAKAFPQAETVLADYADRASLETATRDVDGVFAVTPTGTDEAEAMGNLVAALHTTNPSAYVVRLLGMQPESNPRRIPQWLRDHGFGLPIQHPIAKSVLDESDLPVTYLNCGATFMDNFLRWQSPALRQRRTLVWPERLIPYIDPVDIAETAGRLFLSTNQRHFGQFHTMNNGHDLLYFRDAAKLMSDVWAEPITYEGSREDFNREYTHMGEQRLNFLWNFFQYERDNEVVWALNDFVERMLGRKPKTLAQWLAENRDAILGS